MLLIQYRTYLGLKATYQARRTFYQIAPGLLTTFCFHITPSGTVNKGLCNAYTSTP